MKAEDIKLGAIIYLCDFTHKGIFAAKVTNVKFAEGELVKDSVIIEFRTDWKHNWNKSSFSVKKDQDMDNWVYETSFHDGLDYSRASFNFELLKEISIGHIREFIERDIEDLKKFLKHQEEMTEDVAKEELLQTY